MGGRLWWLWVFATARTVVYAIQDGRGFDQAAAVLGAEFDGVLAATAGRRIASSIRRRIKPASRI